ncbi:5'-3' exoribonuclease 3-like [Senna tora]|uniref:5'-3' exoribonuclease 3-like n=1 Tax=Senna tora TaxID=362788 RepID=A0A834XDE0_9FABA|nr:5'-3' exoribonuclease 3-like [Senna tora]
MHDLKIQYEDTLKTVCIDFERIVDDFIFIVFFCGNDFLPHMPTLEIYKAIDLLITVYKKEFKNLGGYLVDMSRVDEKNASFMKLSRVEKFIQKKQEEENAISISDHENENSYAFFCDNNSVPTDSEILQNTKDLKEQLNKYIRQKSDLFNSVPSWTWFYPYNYGPFTSDLKGMSQVRVKFEKGVPFKPFDQLLAVLPPRSWGVWVCLIGSGIKWWTSCCCCGA